MPFGSRFEFPTTHNYRKHLAIAKLFHRQRIPGLGTPRIMVASTVSRSTQTVQERSTAAVEDPSNHSPVAESGSSAVKPDELTTDLLKQLISYQKQTCDVLSDRLSVRHDLALLAEQEWRDDVDIWINSKQSSTFSDKGLGDKFLESVAPWASAETPSQEDSNDDESRSYPQRNLDRAREWLTRQIEDERRFLAMNPQLAAFAQGDLLIESDRWKDYWPDAWETPFDKLDPRKPETSRFLTPEGELIREIVIRETNIEEEIVFEYGIGNVATTASCLRLLHERTEQIKQKSPCGIILRCSGPIPSDSKHQLRTAAGVLCLSRNNEVLIEQHYDNWTLDYGFFTPRIGDFEAPALLKGAIDNPQVSRSFFFGHLICAFSPPRQFGSKPIDERRTFGKRPFVTLEGFYTNVKATFYERRCSIGLHMFPFGGPSGFYSIAIMTDRRSTRSIKLDEMDTWSKYKIFPAGLYTGECAFLVELCHLIEWWEDKWNETLVEIDKLVSLDFDLLENSHLLEDIVLGAKSDKSVTYFKALQVLRLFTDSVEAAPRSLVQLSTQIGKAGRGVDKEIFTPTVGTKIILDHNWDMVVTLQNEATARLLAKLERTTNEVQSLMDGLFNVQSINEAQKGRLLNKYLFVFTVVTIVFLPPSFVATFFSTGLFDAASTVATQRLFWAVLAGLSGGTYILAAVGLFGSGISSEKREEWRKRATDPFRRKDNMPPKYRARDLSPV